MPEVNDFSELMIIVSLIGYGVIALAFGAVTYVALRDYDSELGQPPETIPTALLYGTGIGLGWPIVICIFVVKHHT